MLSYNIASAQETGKSFIKEVIAVTRGFIVFVYLLQFLMIYSIKCEKTIII